jgi:hypothetical protein
MRPDWLVAAEFALSLLTPLEASPSAEDCDEDIPLPWHAPFAFLAAALQAAPAAFAVTGPRNNPIKMNVFFTSIKSAVSKQDFNPFETVSF